MKLEFKLEGLGCAHCASKMEKKINKIDGVESASINFFTQKLIIEGVESEELIDEVSKVVKKIESGVVLRKL